MHINEALAKILGERKATDNMGTFAYIPDYLNDANEALRAFSWLTSMDREKNDYDVSANLSTFDNRWCILPLCTPPTIEETFCLAICKAVIQHCKAFNPDLIDYDAIEWEENDA